MKECAMNHQSYQHLTLEQRIEIQECLSHGMTFKAIGRRIGKDQTTVSREIKRHAIIKQSNLIRTDQTGASIAAKPCELLLKAPFVCNACKHSHHTCSFDKHIYRAKDAQKAYESEWKAAREGIPLNKETFYENDRIITQGLRNGQHLYHILQTHELNVPTSTVYRYLKKGYLSACAIDFPRVVKFKPRAPAYSPFVPKTARIGRTYADFLLFKEENDISSWVEMDTVIGSIGGKVILTLDFVACNFMAGFLLPDKNAVSVSSSMLLLKNRFISSGMSFGAIFPIILTDNGGEFSDVLSIENDLNGSKETNLFFCDPARSSQKPHVEKNHTLLRDIVPKGSSFDSFSQGTVDLIFSHINSVKRKSLNGKTPYQVFSFLFGDDLPALFGIENIPAERVIQSPILLK